MIIGGSRLKPYTGSTTKLKLNASKIIEGKQP
jgi:hypothetical protein